MGGALRGQLSFLSMRYVPKGQFLTAGFFFVAALPAGFAILSGLHVPANTNEDGSQLGGLTR